MSGNSSSNKKFNNYFNIFNKSIGVGSRNNFYYKAFTLSLFFFKEYYFYLIFIYLASIGLLLF